MGISVTLPALLGSKPLPKIHARSMAWSTLVLLLHSAELLAGEQFSTLHEAKVLIEQWRRHYNAVRPHSSLGYRPPAPETILPPASALPYGALRPAQTLATSGRSLT